MLLDLTPTDRLRFWEKIEEDENGCWLWMAARDEHGYGTVKIQHWGGKTVPAHRLSWMIRHDGIFPFSELDHLCRVPACVNPDHLEPVTRSENVRRGYAAGSRARTHCKNGHEFTPENTYTNQEANGNWRRQCRTCILARSAARYDEFKRQRDAARKSGRTPLPTWPGDRIKRV